MVAVRPFMPPEIKYTMVSNVILEHIMPDLSGSGWKILCVAIRKTLGWSDPNDPTQRKEKDRISYSQFLEGSGIKSTATVSKALKECLAKNYLLRYPSEDHKQGYEYGLNRNFEILVEETTLVSEEVTTLETEVVLRKTTSVSKDTKERDKEKGKKRGSPSSFTKRQQLEQKYAHVIEH